MPIGRASGCGMNSGSSSLRPRRLREDCLRTAVLIAWIAGRSDGGGLTGGGGGGAEGVAYCLLAL
jgi:hypothetical protein